MLLLTLFLLIFQAHDLPAASLSALDFSAIRQGPVKFDQGCLPLHSREITFRLRNQSDKTIYVHGLKRESGYQPFGYLIRFDGEKNQWLQPDGTTSHRPYSEISDFIVKYRRVDSLEIRVLRPGKSITFSDLAQEKHIGSRIKRGLYISFSENEEPRMVTSEEFMLR